MSKIIPFRGIRYNSQRIENFSKVVAPPYDVISEEQRKVLCQKSPYNVTWIDLPKDQDSQNKYQVAGRVFSEWKRDGVLIQDEKPSLYLYFQTFSLPDGRRLTRRGFFARRRLESFSQGAIRPHERTFSGPKEDRLHLMRATSAQLSPIFVLYGSPQKQNPLSLETFAAGEPLIHIREENGHEHRLWKIQDEASVRQILENVHDRPLLIADGHHRYETALNYFEERRMAVGADYTGQESFNYVMMYFCGLEDHGLVVLPTHRVLAQRPEGEEGIFRGLIQKVATIKPFAANQFKEALAYMEEEGKREHLIAWVHDDKIEVMLFDPEKILESEMLNHLHFALRDLDVTLLHDLVLAEFMGLSKGAQREYGNVFYIQDPQEVLRMVREKNSYGFLLNPTKMSQIEAVTDIGETMPQKSTFFYPKLLTGLVFNDLA